MSIEQVLVAARRVDRTNVPVVCGVEGCLNSHLALNLCSAHYQKFYAHKRKNGLQKLQYSFADVEPVMSPLYERVKTPVCNVADCGGGVMARGLCNRHYKVWWRNRG